MGGSARGEAVIYGSVCSGIEAASVAWHPLGWRPRFFAEIAPFPSRVLAHRWPEVPNHGDFTRIGIDGSGSGGVDLLVGGTPCQSFSVAGLRGGMDDARGNLSLEFLRLAGRLGARWVVWENVPGVLSIDGGRAFGSILGGLAKLGYGFAYRILDAQYFGVPQRRRRVFVVGYLGSWRRAAAVLFERASLSRDPAPRRKAGAEVAGTPGGGSSSRGWCNDLDRCGAFVPVTARARSACAQRYCGDTDTFIAEPIPFDTTQITSRVNRSRADPGAPCHTLSKGGAAPAIAFHMTQDPISGPASPALGRTTSGMGVCSASRVRRLTPRECERLQGFPDDYTAIPGAKDGPRYAAIGNSMATTVMRWIGERIDAVDRL